MGLIEKFTATFATFPDRFIAEQLFLGLGELSQLLK